MKKRNYLILILSVIFLLTSCGVNSGTSNTVLTSDTILTSDTTKATTPPPPGGMRPDYITAITCNNDFDEAKAFVEKRDLSVYDNEKDIVNIGKMFDAFHDDGYLVRVKSEGAVEEKFNYLGPDYNKQNPHIDYMIYTEDTFYHVTIWYPDDERLEKAKEISPENFEVEYDKQYYSYDPEQWWETLEYSGSNLGTATKIYAHIENEMIKFWIDDTHYVTVWAFDTNREALIEFAKTLTFEQVPLEK